MLFLSHFYQIVRQSSSTAFPSAHQAFTCPNEYHILFPGYLQQSAKNTVFHFTNFIQGYSDYAVYTFIHTDSKDHKSKKVGSSNKIVEVIIYEMSYIMLDC